MKSKLCNTIHGVEHTSKEDLLKRAELDILSVDRWYLHHIHSTEDVDRSAALN